MAQLVEQKQPAGGRGAGYGLDAALAQKREACYDMADEGEVRKWIETVIGQTLASVMGLEDGEEIAFGPALKNGVALCKVINAIKPGSVRKINESKMPFKQMENVSLFLKGCRAVGVPEHSLFETVDLYEQKDMGLVVTCLYALGSAVQATVPEFEGPHLGAKMATKNARSWTADQLAKSKQDAAGSTKLHAGSAGIMERPTITKTGITMGAEYAGTGDSSVMTKGAAGSSGIMERPTISKTGITMGADSSGPPIHR